VSERVELMRQRAREEAAEAQLRRAQARSLTKEPLPIAEQEKPKRTWWGAIRRTYGIVGGEIRYAGEIPPDRTPCRMCGVRADVGCKHTGSDK
jgi:hypothetical protein